MSSEANETDALLARSLAEEAASRNMDILDAAADAWINEANVLPLIDNIIRAPDQVAKRCDLTLNIVRQAFVEGAMRMRFAGQDAIDAARQALPSQADDVKGTT